MSTELASRLNIFRTALVDGGETIAPGVAAAPGAPGSQPNQPAILKSGGANTTESDLLLEDDLSKFVLHSMLGDVDDAPVSAIQHGRSGSGSASHPAAAGDNASLASLNLEATGGEASAPSTPIESIATVSVTTASSQRDVGSPVGKTPSQGAKAVAPTPMTGVKGVTTSPPPQASIKIAVAPAGHPNVHHQASPLPVAQQAGPTPAGVTRILPKPSQPQNRQMPQVAARGHNTAPNGYAVQGQPTAQTAVYATHAPQGVATQPTPQYMHLPAQSVVYQQAPAVNSAQGVQYSMVYSGNPSQGVAYAAAPAGYQAYATTASGTQPQYVAVQHAQQQQQQPQQVQYTVLPNGQLAQIQAMPQQAQVQQQQQQQQQPQQVVYYQYNPAQGQHQQVAQQQVAYQTVQAAGQQPQYAYQVPAGYTTATYAQQGQPQMQYVQAVPGGYQVVQAPQGIYYQSS